MGTPEGAVLSANGWSMRVRLDDEALKKIASTTRGEYFRAGSATDLNKIYQYLSARLAFDKSQSTEITAVLVALGACLSLLSAALFLRFAHWQPPSG